MPTAAHPTRYRPHGLARRGVARLLTFSCFNRQPLLGFDETRSMLLGAIECARAQHAFHIWAFVIMPEHVHLLLVPGPSGVGPALASIKAAVSHRAAPWLERHVPALAKSMIDVPPRGAPVCRFWQRGMGDDHDLRSPEHIWDAIDCLHMNPVRRGLCADPRDWIWSSAGEHDELGAGMLRLDPSLLPARP